MSKFDLLTEHEAASARQQGWLLCPVYCLNKKRWQNTILPVEFKAPFNNASKMGAWVISRARQGDALALKALRLLVQGTQ